MTPMNDKDTITIDPWQGWKRLSFACQATGLKRSWFYPKIKGGQIRSAVLKDGARSRGIRLIYMPSLRDYIEQNLIEESQDS